jgi:hypothetical protein
LIPAEYVSRVEQLEPSGGSDQADPNISTMMSSSRLKATGTE